MVDSLIPIFQKQDGVVYLVIEVFDCIFIIGMILFVAFDSLADFNVEFIECLF